MSGQDGAKIWEDFNRSFTPDDKRVSIIAEAWMLFGQAARAFDADVHTGTVVLCRASIESAFFLFLTRKWNNGILNLSNPLNLSGEVRNVEFDEIARAIRKRIKFSQKQLAAISRIQEDGNFLAHFANRRVRAVQRWGEEVSRASKNIMERLGRTPVTPDEWRRAFGATDKKVKIWVSPDQALEDLQDTASILLTVAKAVAVS